MARFALALLSGIAAFGFAYGTQAADLIVESPEMPMTEFSNASWDGAYVGAFAGYGWGILSDDQEYWNLGPGLEFDISGWQVGVSAGANITLAEAVLVGIAGDLAWANIGGDHRSGDFPSEIHLLGSLRGRLGFDGGAFLPYVTAGVAFANNTLTDFTNAGVNDTQLHVGGTAGFGVEFAVADDVSLDLQYRYSDYGSKTYSLAGDYDFGLTSVAVTAGINWRF